MGLENSRVIDASGIERSSGAIVLSVIDSWTWDDEEAHLLALQAKLNAYFDFVEAGEVRSLYPNAVDRPIVIDIIFRVAPSDSAKQFLEKAEGVARDLGIALRNRVIPR